MLLFCYMVGDHCDHPELGITCFVHTPFYKLFYLFPVHGSRLLYHVFFNLTRQRLSPNLPPPGLAGADYSLQQVFPKYNREKWQSPLQNRKWGFGTLPQKRAVGMKMIENDTCGGFGLSPNPATERTNLPLESANHIGLYQKCLNCQDYGVTCNGPKLAALGDIMVVREFHRAIKTARKITLKDIAAAAPSISEYTVNDYFSHSVKDFKWTTVGVIDNALTAICGNRVGQPLLDNPCPASSSEIRQEQEEFAARMAAAEARCLKLQGKLEAADEQKAKALQDQEQAYSKNIAYLKELADKRFNLLLKRDRTILVLGILCALFFAGFMFYFCWDLMHPLDGMIRW